MMMVRKSKGLGERHQKILDFIQEYQHEYKHPPLSVRSVRIAIFLRHRSLITISINSRRAAILNGIGKFPAAYA